MRHAAHVAHHSRGRLRIRVPSAKGDPAALEVIRASLAGVSGVNEVLVNETIGTVTIHYDPDRHGNFEQHLAIESSQPVVSVGPPPKLEDLSEMDGMIEHEAEFLAQHSHFAKAIADSIGSIDKALKRATGNNLDFKVVAPLALAVGAFMELGVTAATPVWVTLGLFSFNHFVELHTHSGESAPRAAENPPKRPRKRRFP